MEAAHVARWILSLSRTHVLICLSPDMHQGTARPPGMLVATNIQGPGALQVCHCTSGGWCVCKRTALSDTLEGIFSFANDGSSLFAGPRATRGESRLGGCMTFTACELSSVTYHGVCVCARASACVLCSRLSRPGRRDPSGPRYVCTHVIMYPAGIVALAGSTRSPLVAYHITR